jgi:hypothetical protein
MRGLQPEGVRLQYVAKEVGRLFNSRRPTQCLEMSDPTCLLSTYSPPPVLVSCS